MPIPWSSFALPSRASWAIEPPVSRDPLRGPAVGEDPERLLALQLEHVREQLELLDHLGVARKRGRHSAIIGTVPRAVVCLPTYNERENLGPMMHALLERLGPDDRVLVIDDASPDGTGEIADRLADEHARVAVLHRERREGLGPAYLAGFRRALEEGAELVLEMDCDFSHDPDDVPRLIDASTAGRPRPRLALRPRRADRELGPRPPIRLARRLRSTPRCCCAAPVRDLTGGFKCYRREVLERIDLEAVSSRGYAFQIETTYRALRAGFRVDRDPDHVRRP